MWQGDRNLSTYDDHFQSQFLEATKREAKQSANLWNSNRNCPEYLNEVKKALENEEVNADFWLQPETKKYMLTIVEKEMISTMAESVCAKDTGCVYMFEQGNLDEL